MGSGTSPKGSAGGGNATPGNEKKGKAKPGGPELEEAQKCCGCRFPLLVALLQLLLGIAVAGVAFLMVTISPSLLARETPHWAGIIVSFLLLFINLSLNSQHALFTLSCMRPSLWIHWPHRLLHISIAYNKHAVIESMHASKYKNNILMTTYTLQGLFTQDVSLHLKMVRNV